VAWSEWFEGLALVSTVLSKFGLCRRPTLELEDVDLLSVSNLYLKVLGHQLNGPFLI
jgi:hypothetical protein